MMEEFRQDYLVPPFKLVNYINLSMEEKMIVLDARNSEEVRKWMTSTEPISLESHLYFIDKLKTSDKSFYWAVFLEHRCVCGESVVVSSMEESSVREGPVGKRFVGGVSLVGMKDMDADSGIFMIPSFIGSGIGVQLSIVSTDFYFRKLGMRALHSVVNKDNVSALRMSSLLGCKFGVETDGFIPTMLSKEDFLARREKLMRISLIR